MNPFAPVISTGRPRQNSSAIPRLIPLLLRLQDQLTELADGAFAASGFGHVVGDRAREAGRVMDGDREADVTEHLVVVEIVADVGDLVEGEPVALGDAAQGGQLIEYPHPD